VHVCFKTFHPDDELIICKCNPIFVSFFAVSEGKSASLAVLVFVHGDDFSYGAGYPYDPSMLASQENIIVVTMNYRLGILGTCFSFFTKIFPIIDMKLSECMSEFKRVSLFVFITQ